MRISLTCALLALFPLVACGGGGAAPAGAAAPRIAFVSNCVAEFWTIAAHGVDAARAGSGAEVTVQMPPNGTAEEQTRILEDALGKGVQAIAVSPKDPANMTPLLDRIAARALLITHDSDAPQSKRLCYVGMDNYEAGRMCGQLVREALPQGGALVILVGTLDQDNARRRRQGLIDELLDRSVDNTRFDAQDAVLKGGKYEIRASYTDQFDRQKCKSIAQDVLGRWGDVAGLIGLFEYEPPLLLEAVKSAGKLGAVKVIAFDENPDTLQGILDGHVHGTVVQNPFEYGRASVELLGKLLRETDPARRQALLPPGGFLNIPARKITKAEVAAFWADLKQKTKAR
jgi:ribose transport system substrate-binding protein